MLGHFGRNEPTFTWEKTDKKAEALKERGCEIQLSPFRSRITSAIAGGAVAWFTTSGAPVFHVRDKNIPKRVAPPPGRGRYAR